MLHGCRASYVSIYVTRLALSLCLAAILLSGPAFAADDLLNQALKGLQDRYNRAKTLRVSFNETYTVQGRPHQSESGTLTLRKPGRMRWDYATPPGKLFLSDGKDVYLYTPDAKRVEKMKLKESEDWRAPLAFLLGKLDFQREFRDIQIKSAGSAYVITAKAKSDKLPYEDVRITMTTTYTITNLVVTGQDQSILTFDFANEKLNPAVDDVIFKFQMPAGATMVTPETGQ
jgi:outer membrane lipoprotein carrier protein